MENRTRFVRALAGSLVLLGGAGGYLYDEILYVIPSLVGLSLLQSAFTKVCPAGIMYDKATE